MNSERGGAQAARHRRVAVQIHLFLSTPHVPSRPKAQRKRQGSKPANVMKRDTERELISIDQGHVASVSRRTGIRFARIGRQSPLQTHPALCTTCERPWTQTRVASRRREADGRRGGGEEGETKIFMQSQEGVFRVREKKTERANYTGETRISRT